ncbi:MAG: alpha/beta hydrolase family protein [Gammaproteobacteria bacterium]|nr:alpha/beta hydrolase family protein [Gammaproteobacteria bacterium]MDH5800793.1 alpha/beta hydrolase family protein [Gammaproteobacteria bacterium]
MTTTSLQCPGADHLDEAALSRTLEQSVATQALPGKALWLKTAASEFLSLYIPSSKHPQRGGIILLHDNQTHAAWPQVIQPLRTQLPHHGWSTLSLQLPTNTTITSANVEQLKKNCAERIDSAIEYYKSQEIKNIVLLGYGTGATLALAYETQKPRAVISVSLAPLTDQTPVEIPKKTPVLDIVAALTPKNQLILAQTRKSITQKTRHPAYFQRIIPGSKRSYDNTEGILLSYIRSWLARYAVE